MTSPLPQPRDKTKPMRVTSVTARNKRTGALEHYRSRDTRATKEDVICRFGFFLASLDWRAEEIIITNCCTEVEDVVTQSVRNRMVRPRA